MRLTLCAALAATAAVTLWPSSGGAASPAIVRLSDESTFTRTADPVQLGIIRTRPDRGAKAVGRLHYFNEDGMIELYLALATTTDATGTTWTQIRVLGRPNGRKGWVHRDTLGPYRLVRTHLVVNRRTLHATLYRNGHRIWRSPIGVGKASTPTPAGRFYIRERLRNLGHGDPIYGPLAFGTSAYAPHLTEWPRGGVVGIHGTNQPQLIPGRPSHGCIRVPNRNIRRLWRLMPIGTSVRIL